MIDQGWAGEEIKAERAAYIHPGKLFTERTRRTEGPEENKAQACYQEHAV